MKRIRLATLIATPTAALLAAVAVAYPASAATAGQKLSIMSRWSQSATSSYDAWNSGRLNPSKWSGYRFDWSTDRCSQSPDQPLGFDFRLPCERHDFGYRNYKAMEKFPANKSRIDSAFYFDLQGVCSRYSTFLQPECNSLAWTYYHAVDAFGNLSVSDAEITAAVSAARSAPE